MTTLWRQPPSLGKSRLQAILANRLERSGLGGFVTEHYFAKPRLWRFDFAYPDAMLAVEVEGGGWVHGRHVRGSGYAKDLVKYAEAVALGWHLLRVDGAMIESNAAVEYVRRCLERAYGPVG